MLEFSADDADAERLAEALAHCLAPTGGWYANFNTDALNYIGFADRVFRYPRGDAAGREEAREHARSVRVPESQLDWDD